MSSENNHSIDSFGLLRSLMNRPVQDALWSLELFDVLTHLKSADSSRYTAQALPYVQGFINRLSDPWHHTKSLKEAAMFHNLMPWMKLGITLGDDKAYSTKRGARVLPHVSSLTFDGVFKESLVVRHFPEVDLASLERFVSVHHTFNETIARWLFEGEYSSQLKELTLSLDKWPEAEQRRLFNTEQMSSLERVNLSNNELPQDVVGTMFSRPLMQQVRHATLENVPLGTSFIDGLLDSDATSRLVSLAIGRDGLGQYALPGGELCRLLEKGEWDRLEVLNLRDREVSARALEQIMSQKFEGLQVLNLYGSLLTSDLSGLLKPSSGGLTQLNLGHNRLGTSGVRDFLGTDCTSLERLDIASNQLGLGDLDELCLAFERLPWLRRLNLASNRMKQETILALAERGVFHGLTHLNLSRNPLRFHGLSRLISMDGVLNSLESLTLEFSQLGSSNSKLSIIPEVTWPKMRSLDLGECHMGADSLIDLLDSVKMPNLKSLNLAGNDLGDVGALYLAESPQCQGLMSLNVERNNFTPCGFELLVQSPHLSERIKSPWRAELKNQ